MEIGPITGVRAVSLHRPPKTESAEQPRFEIEATECLDDTYSPDNQREERGVEEGCAEVTGDEEPSPTEPLTRADEGSTINVVV